MSGGRTAGGGRMLLIGGAEDPDENDMRILPHLVQMGGGKRTRILICSAPSAEPERKVRVYEKLFRKIGVSEVYEAAISDRLEADDPKMLERAKRATTVFITGGDQLRLTALVAGTEFFNILEERLLRGEVIVAGTSAGAAAASGTMIIGGAEKATVRRSDVDLAPGLGLWRNSIIDTHFNQRGRVHRLLTIFAQNPQILGIGLDENTAIDLIPGKRFSVIGEACVTVFDGRVTHSNAPDAGDADPLALTDVVLHVLPDGYGFDLEEKRPILPKKGKLPKA